MSQFVRMIQFLFSCLGAYIGYFLGGYDGFLLAIIVFVAVDYITGVICAIHDKKLSSSIGFKGIAKKIFIFLIIGISNILDTQILKTGNAIRTAAIFFYISNEGISILENAARLDLPIPEKIRTILEQLKEGKA